VADGGCAGLRIESERQMLDENFVLGQRPRETAW